MMAITVTNGTVSPLKPVNSVLKMSSSVGMRPFHSANHASSLVFSSAVFLSWASWISYLWAAPAASICFWTSLDVVTPFLPLVIPCAASVALSSAGVT